MTDTTQILTPKQESAIAALIAQPTIRGAAKAVNIGEKTLYRWLQDEDFQAAYRAARRDAVQHAITVLQRASSTAADTLIEIMTDAATPAGMRLTAASKVLDMALRSVEAEDIEARLIALERELQEGHDANQYHDAE